MIGTRNKQPYFSRSKNGKTELIYLGRDREKQARKQTANYKKLMALVDEMTALNMELLKHHVEP